MVASPSEESALEDDLPVAPIIQYPAVLPEYSSRLRTLSETSINLGGVEYPRGGHTFVSMEKGTGQDDLYMQMLSGGPASLPRIGQLVPHV